MTERRSERSPSARLTALDGLRIQRFDDEAVVFDPMSWDAHLLNPAAIAVLEMILEAPRSEADVVKFLAEALQPNEQTAAAAHGARLIQDLKSLGLVQVSPPSAGR